LLSDSKKQPHRIDHTLTWQQTAPLDPDNDGNGHAYARIELKVTGNEVAGYRNYVKIPDECRANRKSKACRGLCILSERFWLTSRLARS